jgi:hypothetical protein
MLLGSNGRNAKPEGSSMARTYRTEKTYLTREESKAIKHSSVRFHRQRKERFKELLCDMRRGQETSLEHRARHWTGSTYNIIEPCLVRGSFFVYVQPVADGALMTEDAITAFKQTLVEAIEAKEQMHDALKRIVDSHVALIEADPVDLPAIERHAKARLRAIEAARPLVTPIDKNPSGK